MRSLRKVLLVSTLALTISGTAWAQGDNSGTHDGSYGHGGSAGGQSTNGYGSMAQGFATGLGVGAFYGNACCGTVGAVIAGTGGGIVGGLIGATGASNGNSYEATAYGHANTFGAQQGSDMSNNNAPGGGQ